MTILFKSYNLDIPEKKKFAGCTSHAAQVIWWWFVWHDSVNFICSQNVVNQLPRHTMYFFVSKMQRLITNIFVRMQHVEGCFEKKLLMMQLNIVWLYVIFMKYSWSFMLHNSYKFLKAVGIAWTFLYYSRFIYTYNIHMPLPKICYRKIY